LNLLQHKYGRILIAFAFYFAEGAPIGFIWWALPTLMRKEGIAVDTIATLTTLFTLPWVFKFLWAPMIDVFRSPRFGFIKWIGVSQAMMCITLLPLLYIPLHGNEWWWGLMLLLHSFCAATQDVSVDALVINVVAKKETGMLNGYMQAGMLLGRSLFGGGALLMVSQAGLHNTIIMMIAVMLCVMVLLVFIKEPGIINNGTVIQKDFRKLLQEVFYEKQTWMAVAFALTSAAAFEAAGALSGPLFSDQKIELAMLFGGMAGGYLSDRMSRKNSVMFFLLGFVTAVLCISLFHIFLPHSHHYIFMILYAVMYFFTGMFTTASYALFMNITNPKLGATQFSVLMAATNGCESWTVLVAGMIAAAQGYGYAFMVMCLISLLSLLFLKKIKTNQIL
jgi:MFS transporter, PAT family, beta-lactamase induction signal transducer AmpG